MDGNLCGMGNTKPSIDNNDMNTWYKPRDKRNRSRNEKTEGTEDWRILRYCSETGRTWNELISHFGMSSSELKRKMEQLMESEKIVMRIEYGKRIYLEAE